MCTTMALCGLLYMTRSNYASVDIIRPRARHIITVVWEFADVV
jgi:hypothetical protein